MAEWKPPDRSPIGVGMPAWLHLNAWGLMLWEAFGGPAYLVGSATTSKQWRDVDVRLILDDVEFDRMFGERTRPIHCNARWCAMSAAFSEWGRAVTGLPIDFQFDRMTEANEEHAGAARRVPLGLYHRKEPE